MVLNQDSGCSGGTERLLGIVILNYNGFDDTVACVECFPADAHGVRVFVVDNASSDDSFERLERNRALRLRDYCELIQSGSNLGYAGGNNIGIRRALECGCTHICVLNNDTVVELSEVYKLADYLDADTSCAFVGPVLVENNGAGQTVQSAGASINLWTGDVSVRSSGVARGSLKGSFPCDYIGGACIMFRADDVTELGLIPECYFLFFEETEWCLRAQHMGRTVVCCADAAIVHKGSSSIGKIEGLSAYLLARNTMRFELRNASKVQAAVCLAYNAAYYCAKSLLRHDGSIKRVGYMLDGVHDVVREPYKSVVKLCER